jgi:hypothetical protein
VHLSGVTIPLTFIVVSTAGLAKRSEAENGKIKVMKRMARKTFLLI